MKKRNKRILKVGLSLFLCICFLGFFGVHAEAAETGKAVSIGTIDYSYLSMEVIPGDNSIVYYSKDKKNWYELDSYTGSQGEKRMDISWVSATTDTKLYFKGNQNSKIVTVVLPKRNAGFSAVFDKVEGTIEFNEYEDASCFEWRKTTDYNWQKVSLDETAPDYKKFQSSLEAMRVKSTKILVRTPAINGKNEEETGARPSKEVTVTLSARSNAPNVTLNIKKLVLNTTIRQEYSLDGENWQECDKNMELKNVLPQVFAGTDGTLYIRTAATEKTGYSKTTMLQVSAQRSAPEKSKLSSYVEATANGKNTRFVLQFADATSANAYEFVVVKPGTELDESKANWRSVTSSRVIKLNQSSVPEGSAILYRYKGTPANKGKGINAVLPSMYGTYAVSYK